MQKKRLEPWSFEVLQAMETHLGLNQKDQEECGQSSAQCDMDMGPDLELECKVPLPHGWEQFLDLKTGQVYYIDWKSCRRSYTDPRKVFHNVGKTGSRLFDPQSEITQSGSMHGDPDDDDEATAKMHAKNGAIHDDDDIDIITYPMLQEDWDLMASRGWTSSMADDDHSEIGNEVIDKIQIPNIRKEECEVESVAKIAM